MDFAKFVKKSMEAKNLSVRAVAKQIGIDASFFSKILSGKRSPPSEEKVLKKLAKAISVDPVYLTFLAGRIPSEFQELFLSERFISLLHKAMKSSSDHIKSNNIHSEITKKSDETEITVSDIDAGSSDEMTEELL